MFSKAMSSDTLVGSRSYIRLQYARKHSLTNSFIPMRTHIKDPCLSYSHEEE